MSDNCKLAGKCRCHCERYCGNSEAPGEHCGNHGNGCRKLCSKLG